jgi:hypothetical protein
MKKCLSMLVFGGVAVTSMNALAGEGPILNVINLSPGEGKIHPQRGLCVVLSQQHRNNIAAVRAS